MKNNEFEKNLEKLINVSYPAEYDKEFKDGLFKRLVNKMENNYQTKFYFNIGLFVREIIRVAVGSIFILIPSLLH